MYPWRRQNARSLKSATPSSSLSKYARRRLPHLSEGATPPKFPIRIIRRCRFRKCVTLAAFSDLRGAGDPHKRGVGTPLPNEGSGTSAFSLLFSDTCARCAFVLCQFCVKKRVRSGRVFDGVGV